MEVLKSFNPPLSLLIERREVPNDDISSTKNLIIARNIADMRSEWQWAVRGPGQLPGESERVAVLASLAHRQPLPALPPPLPGRVGHQEPLQLRWGQSDIHSDNFENMTFGTQ